MVADLSRLLSGDVQPEATAAHLVITKQIMIALPAQPALSRDQEQPASPPAPLAALAPTRQQDPLPAPTRAQLARTPMGQLVCLALPARTLLLLVYCKVISADRVQQDPFPCRHGRHLLV